MAVLDFASRYASFDERNQLILQGLSGGPKWILDIGTNLGDVANALAEKGHFVVGVEREKKEAAIAARNAKPGVGIICAPVTTEMLNASPQWGAILLLSVLHRIYAFSGTDAMRTILRDCAARTDNMFIEGSTRHARYTDVGQPSPDFVSLDVESAADWHRQIFLKELGPAWRIATYKPLPCSKAEPFRIFFHLQRSARS